MSSPAESFALEGGHLDSVACPCGNTPSLSGFGYVDPDGTPRPEGDPGPAELFACHDCGRYGSQLDADGDQVPVLGTVAPAAVGDAEGPDGLTPLGRTVAAWAADVDARAQRYWAGQEA